MTCKPFLLGVALLLAACGNYSNEDLEFMNAIPAGEDISANMPPSGLVTGEAELSAETHKVIETFNGWLDILKGVDFIRSLQPNGRIPNGRIWGPFNLGPEHPLWEGIFTVTRDPNAPTMFTYWLDVRPLRGDTGWIRFVDGTFVSTGGGVRQGMGTFRIQGDGVRVANFGILPGPDGNLFRELTVMYSTAAFPISVNMTMVLSPAADLTNRLTITYYYEQQSDGRAGMRFAGTDSASGAMIGVESRWLATGRGRADATATDGTVSGTRTQCWNDSFMETYNYQPWEDPSMPGVIPPIVRGDPSLCPDISTL